MKKIFLVAFLVLSASIVSAQNMTQNSFYSLFSDQKANSVGDAITVIVLESSQASNNAETSAGRTNDIGFNFDGSVSGKELPGASIGMNSESDFNGAGSTRASGMIRTKISASVDSILQNGNLLITGNKKIEINGEEQTVFIKGIVRPTDIMADNSVLSFNLSEAEIVFEGSGLIDNVQKPGWLTRFFNWLF